MANIIPVSPKYTLAVMGDSLSNSLSYGVDPFNEWPAVLEAMLQNNGYLVRVRNFARAGNTTTQMLARYGNMLTYDTPKIQVIFGGVNDPGASINAATTQKNIESMTLWGKFGCIGTVAGQANLPLGGHIGDRYVVISDTSTTGGLALQTGQVGSTTITGTNSGQTVWEYRTGAAGEEGWGRIGLPSTTPDKAVATVIVSTQYKNFSSNAGDNNNVDTGFRYTEGTSTDSALSAVIDSTYAGVRVAQLAAATAQSVTYCDLYTYMSRWISSGKAVQGGSDSSSGQYRWHVYDGNQHFGEYGHSIVALAIYNSLSGISGLLNSLKN